MTLPGFGRPEGAAKQAGLVDVAEELSIPFADFTDGRQISFPEGKLIKQWFFANGVLDADGLVSLSKMKTHGLTRMTGADQESVRVHTRDTQGRVPRQHAR